MKEDYIAVRKIVPEASFTVNIDSAFSPLTVQFTNTSTHAVVYVWDFGDGTSSTEENPIHTFEYNPNTFRYQYPVILTAYDRKGDSSTYYHRITSLKNVPTSNPKTSALDLWVDENVMRIYTKPKYTGISMGFIDGTEEHTYHYGETKRNSGILADDNTLYQIASVTKTLTGIVTIQWLSQKGISIDAQVIDYLPADLKPGLNYAGTPVTFRHLLNHTSGLSSDSFDTFQGCDPWVDTDSVSIYNYIKTHPLLRKPGTSPTEWSIDDYYSNLAFGLLGLILERQHHISLQEIFNQYVLVDMGMSSTVFDDLENHTNISYPYGGYNGSQTCDEIFDHLKYGYSGAGGLISNLHDMDMYIKRLLSPDMNSALGKAILKSHEKQYSMENSSRALPWFMVNLSSGDTIFLHTGGRSGMNTFLAINNTQKKAAVFMTNYWIRGDDWEYMTNMMFQYLTGDYRNSRISSDEVYMNHSIIIQRP
ncbi:MAG: serine hydrolase [Cyclobacteriaceae bacterium]|nr:serine hydrolase [Cyclobacteriaceae bacterium]